MARIAARSALVTAPVVSRETAALRRRSDVARRFAAAEHGHGHGRWRKVAAALVALVAVLLTGCARPPAIPDPPPGPVAPGLPPGVDVVVERVIDGDTIVVSGKRHVRLIGVDTPETVDPNRPVGCFGKEASRFLVSLLPRGSPVRLVGDVEQGDRYGRLLAYVYRRADGLFVNAELVRQGFANVLTIPPNVAHTDELLSLARDARNAGRGLWSACAS